jgi:uncharacterized damage-inducible protein DinB
MLVSWGRRDVPLRHWTFTVTSTTKPMNRSTRTTTLLLLPLIVSACTIQSNDAGGEEPGPDDAESASLAGSEMLGYMEAKIDIADDKFMQLAEAIPEDMYDWRPMEGVRSFREVFIHVAADNWYGGALMGIPTPDDISVSSDDASTGPYQEQNLSKAETLVHLRRSFDYFGEALDATRDQLGTRAMLRTTELTYGDLWVRLVTHMHEHLGQSIAYTRAIEVVPPWSR